MPDVVLEIVGAGRDEPMLCQLAEEMGVTKRVKFAGHKSRQEALRTIAGATLFAQMSLYDGNSLNLIEAAKLGLPLIVSHIQEQREAVTDACGRTCGITVRVHDETCLAEAIRSLLDDSVAYAESARRAANLGDEIRFAALLHSYTAPAELRGP